MGNKYSEIAHLSFSLVFFVILLLCYSILPKFFWQRQIGSCRGMVLINIRNKSNKSNKHF